MNTILMICVLLLVAASVALGFILGRTAKRADEQMKQWEGK
jgi:hypothetical protein